MVSKNPTQTLAAFLLSRKEFPEAVLHEAKRAILGYFAAAFAGIDSPIWHSSHDAMAAISPEGNHRVLGSRRLWTAQDAAFLNAVAGNVLDYDDTHLPTIIHPSSPVVPVLWSMQREHGGSGSELLSTLVLAFEVMCRLGNATHPDAYKRGFHVTATCGAVGAAVAAALRQRCTEQQLIDVIGLSANLGSGLIANLATPAKAVSVGNACRNGLLAPHFVRAGISAAPDALASTFGFIQAMSDSHHPQALTDNLGQTWEISAVAQKPYPTGVVLNPVIDACLLLRNDGGFSIEDIEHINVYGHGLLKDRADRPAINSVPDARLSVQHTVAVTLLHGLPGVSSFHEAAYTNQQIVSLGRRISVHVDDQITVEGARIELVLGSGARIVRQVADGRGSLSNPLSDQDLEDKLVKSARESSPAFDPSQFIELVWRLDTLEDASQMFDCLWTSNR